MLATLQTRFANRKDEIMGVKSLVTQVKTQARPPYYCIVNFFGVAGVGKSTLLARLRDELRSQTIPCALTDFAGGKYDDLETGKTAVLEQIVAQLNGSNNFISSSRFENAVRMYWDGQRQASAGQIVNVDRLVHQVVSEFLGFVHSVLIASPAVLIFDTTEDGEKILYWLQKSIIGELILQAGFLLILAGRQPMKIEDARLLPRMAKPFRLSPFTIESIQEQIPEYAHLASKIFPITFGHPLANMIVANKLKQMESEIDIPLDENSVNANLHLLSRYLCESFIQQNILPRIDNDILSAFRIVALVRRFDSDSLQKLLEKQTDLSQDRSNAIFYLLLLKSMLKTGIVEWDSTRKGYALDETIRRQFAFEMFLNNREKFTALHQVAIEIYNRRITEHPSNKIISLLELLFHSGKLLEAQGNGSVGIVKSLSTLMVDNLNYICKAGGGVDLIPALELFEELQQDRDLRQLCDHQFSGLVSLAKSFIDRNQ